MYYMNDIAKKILSNYKIKNVASIVGINSDTLSKIIKQNKGCIKLTAYALTKFLNRDAEIDKYFIRKD